MKNIGFDATTTATQFKSLQTDFTNDESGKATITLKVMGNNAVAVGADNTIDASASSAKGYVITAGGSVTIQGVNPGSLWFRSTGGNSRVCGVYYSQK